MRGWVRDLPVSGNDQKQSLNFRCSEREREKKSDTEGRERKEEEMSGEELFIRSCPSA